MSFETLSRAGFEEEEEEPKMGEGETSWRNFVKENNLHDSVTDWLKEPKNREDFLTQMVYAMSRGFPQAFSFFSDLTNESEIVREAAARVAEILLREGRAGEISAFDDCLPDDVIRKPEVAAALLQSCIEAMRRGGISYKRAASTLLNRIDNEGGRSNDFLQGPLSLSSPEVKAAAIEGVGRALGRLDWDGAEQIFTDFDLKKIDSDKIDRTDEFNAFLARPFIPNDLKVRLKNMGVPVGWFR